MDAIALFKLQMVMLQFLAFIFGMLWERNLAKRRKQNEEQD